MRDLSVLVKACPGRLPLLVLAAYACGLAVTLLSGRLPGR